MGILGPEGALGSLEALQRALGGLGALRGGTLGEVALVYPRGTTKGMMRAAPVKIVLSARTNFAKLGGVAALPGAHIEVTAMRGGAGASDWPGAGGGLGREGRSNSGLNLSALKRGTAAARGGLEPQRIPIKRGDSAKGAPQAPVSRPASTTSTACKVCEYLKTKTGWKTGEVPAFHWCTRDKTIDRRNLEALPDFGTVGSRGTTP